MQFFKSNSWDYGSDKLNRLSTIVDLLRYRAKNKPTKKAYIFLKDGETESDSLTYGELDQQARIIAANLQSWQGARALLLYPSGLEFITAFFGCLYAGVIAVPVYPPRHNQKLSRWLAIAQDSQAKIALTTSSILQNIDRRWQQEPELLTNLKWVATDTIDANTPGFISQSVNQSSLAMLQYTSGSTGTPKGVMLTHGNIIHNQQLIHQAFGHSEQSIGVGWLPLFHDMGLIGHILQPIYVGFPSILMPPVAFLTKPIRWLKAISQYRATTSGGPNFAYDFCVNKVQLEELANLDLSSWELAYNGAEPVRAATLQQFAKKFSFCGFNYNAFYPCYGMAETTLLAAGGLKNFQPVIRSVKAVELGQNSIVESENFETGNQELVGCGLPYIFGNKVTIVNPESLTCCPEKQVGEIWLSGDNIAAGYWNRPSATKETFQAYLSDTQEGPFLRTGDLGFLLDGELFITGRIKDVIIIRGQNHYPQDIELTVYQSHPTLRANYGAAFTIEFQGKERLVIVQEIERSHLQKLDFNEVVGKIRQAVAIEHFLQVYAVVLVKTGSIPQTSSGKIRRYACKAEFLTGSLQVVGDWGQDPQGKMRFRHLQADVESLLQKVQNKQISYQ